MSMLLRKFLLTLAALSVGFTATPALAVPVSSLPAVTALDNDDVMHVVEDGNSRKATADNILYCSGCFHGARAWMTSDDTAQNITTATAITFDATSYDTDSFWSAGSPTRLTIPSAFNGKYVELVGQMTASSSTADTGALLVIVWRNSSNTVLETFGNFGFNEQSGTQRGQQVFTGPISVATGDYFTLEAREETDTSITIEGDGAGATIAKTYMSIKVLP